MEDKIIKMTSVQTLSILAEKYGLDKSIITGCHNYIPAYTKLLYKKHC